MIIADRQGHTKACTGASDVLNEVTEDTLVLKRVNELLSEKGHSIINCYPGDGAGWGEWNIGVRTCNNSNADIFFSIHFNSTIGGYGSEVVTSSLDRAILPYANRILTNLEGLGFRNRGVKIDDELAETVGIDIPTMIIEVCFVHEKDADIYRSIGVERVARAIANGIDSSISFTSNTIEEGVKFNMKNVVVFTRENEGDGLIAQMWASALPEGIAVNNYKKIDYSKVENVYAVGGNIGTYTGYLKPENFVAGGADRWATLRNFQAKIGK